MTSLIYKLQLKLVKMGLKSLGNANDKFRDSEQFVETCIDEYGIQEFKYASKRLRSDAEFILKYVKEYPYILEFCEEDIIDFYVDDNFIVVEKPMDKLLFAIKCCDENIEAFRYLSETDAFKYYSAAKNGAEIVGKYHGREERHLFNGGEEFLRDIEFVRFGVIQTDFSFLF